MNLDDVNFAEDMEIDKLNLDEECLRQASLYMQYSELAAQAKHDYETAWEREKVLRSRLILEAKDEGGAKNQQQAEAYFRAHPDHKDAKREKLEAERIYNLLNGAVFAIQQRKTMLEMLVRLWSGEYFSTPVHEPIPRKKLEEHQSKKGNRRLASASRGTGNRRTGARRTGGRRNA